MNSQLRSDSRPVEQTGKSAMVREMFAQIAPRYDFLNHALSLNIDKRWRRFVIQKIAEQLKRPQAIALDLCCGTGDLSLELGQFAPTWGIDFCHPMLKIGREKIRSTDLPIEFVEGDALNVPLESERFDVVTMAFGLRNLDSIEGGLREIYRLLKPYGRGAILEFSHPQLAGFRQLFHFYFTRVLPKIGEVISGSGFAYQYLPDSVANFPDQKTLAATMKRVGFSHVEYYNLFGGVAALHIGDKS